MTKKGLLLALLLTALLAGWGCGCGDSAEEKATQKLEGEWYSETPDPLGNTTLLVFEPSEKKEEADQITIQSVRPVGDTLDVDAGTFTVEGDKINFSLSQLGQLEYTFELKQEEGEEVPKLTVEGETYIKGNENGKRLAGQIRFTEISADELVTVSSMDLPYVPGEIIVKGESVQTIRIDPPKRSALVIDPKAGIAANIHQQLKAVSEKRQQLFEAQAELAEHYRREGKEVLYRLLLKTQSMPDDPKIDWTWQLLNMDAVFEYENEFADDPSPVVVAVIDTGIQRDLLSSPEFENRIYRKQDGSVWGHDFVRKKIQIMDDATGELVWANFSLDSDEQCPSGSSDPGDCLSDDPYPWDECDQRNMGIPGTNCSWHGSHLAGTIAAVQDNAAGIAGIASKALIMPVRAVGLKGNGDFIDVANAIRWACRVPNRVDCRSPDGGLTFDTATCDYYDFPVGHSARRDERVRPVAINLSLGVATTADFAAPIIEAVNLCLESGVLVTAAAGNNHRGEGVCAQPDGTLAPGPNCKFFPAAAESTISVGAVTGALSFAASYSNFGPSQWFVAPGGTPQQCVNSTIWPSVNSGLGCLFGTSQATAFVTGTAALIKSYDPSLSPEDLSQILIDTAIYLGPHSDAGWDHKFGYGLINPFGALTSLIGVPQRGPQLGTSINGLDFGAVGDHATVLVYNTGGGNLDLNKFDPKTTSGGEWLKVQPKRLNQPTAPWALVVEVDRTGMEDGTYLGTISVETNGGSRDIAVTMTVDSSSQIQFDAIDDLIRKATNIVDGTGQYQNTDEGDVWIFIQNVDDESLYYAKKTGFQANYNFFLSVDPGRYKLFACADTNENGEFCDEGDELRMGYPTFEAPEVIDCTESCQPAQIVINY